VASNDSSNHRTEYKESLYGPVITHSAPKSGPLPQGHATPRHCHDATESAPKRLSVHLTSSSPLQKLQYSQHIEYNSIQHEERYVAGRAQTAPSQRGPTHRQWKGPRGQPMTGLPRHWPPPRGIPQIQSCVAMPSPSQALEDRVRGVTATQTQKYASERRTGDGAGECLARAGNRSVWQDGGGRVSRLEHRLLAHAGRCPGLSRPFCAPLRSPLQVVLARSRWRPR